MIADFASDIDVVRLYAQTDAVHIDTGENATMACLMIYLIANGKLIARKHVTRGARF